VRLVHHLQKPVRDKDGSALPLSRLDFLLCVPITLAAMACLTFLSQPLSVSAGLRCLTSAVVLAVLIAISTYKKSVAGGVASIIAVRCFIGATVFHQWSMGAACFGFAVIAFLLLRNVKTPD